MVLGELESADDGSGDGSRASSGLDATRLGLAVPLAGLESQRLAPPLQALELGFRVVQAGAAAPSCSGRAALDLDSLDEPHPRNVSADEVLVSPLVVAEALEAPQVELARLTGLREMEGSSQDADCIFPSRYRQRGNLRRSET